MRFVRAEFVISACELALLVMFWCPVRQKIVKTVLCSCVEVMKFIIKCFLWIDEIDLVFKWIVLRFIQNSPYLEFMGSLLYLFMWTNFNCCSLLFNSLSPFLSSIVFSFQFYDLYLKVYFIYIYIMPWNGAWSSPLHILIQPFLIPRILITSYHISGCTCTCTCACRV